MVDDLEAQEIRSVLKAAIEHLAAANEAGCKISWVMHFPTLDFNESDFLQVSSFQTDAGDAEANEKTFAIVALQDSKGDASLIFSKVLETEQEIDGLQPLLNLSLELLSSSIRARQDFAILSIEKVLHEVRRETLGDWVI